jgi:UDP-N-acetylmuramate--alanine ligase
MVHYVDFSGRPFHFIGIGGIGMSALAYVIAKRQIPVSGSDLHSTHITRRLSALGAHIFDQQEAANLEFFQPQATSRTAATGNAVLGKGAAALLTETTTEVSKVIRISDQAQLPQVICSTAINQSNLEYKAALELGCPIFHRSDVLAGLIKNYQSIAVAGTHGKTTTSSLIGYMLVEAGLDPTIVVGGEVNAWEGNARIGESQYLVAEADESDGSLVKFAPAIGIITNIELDHPDHYENLEEVVATFQTFAENCPTLIGCIDCETVRDRLKPAISYSLNPELAADYTVTDVDYGAEGTTAVVWERGEALGVLKLRLLSRHNLSNALAAVAVGRLLGLQFGDIAKGIATFAGARRRFELRGEANGITFIDDYAHHPSEIRVTLAAARLQAKVGQRVVAIFQPHRYSRTLAFLDEFAQSFDDADLIVLTDIYSAGEPNLGQVSGEQLANKIAIHNPRVSYQPNLAAVSEFLTQNLKSGDMALFLGAGNINQVIPDLITTFCPAADATP